MLITRDALLAAVNATEDLPTLPAVWQQIRSAAANPRTGAAQLGRIIENDPAVAARLLKTVNSALYAGPAQPKTTSIAMAAARLGFKEVSKIALSTCVFQTASSMPGNVFDRRSFWGHAISTAYLAAELANEAEARPRHINLEDFHLAGLVHDIGKIFLEFKFGETLETCLEAASRENLPLFEVEDALLGINHAELGARLAESWQLPTVTITAIRHHHTPDTAPTADRFLVGCVHLANYIANREDFGTGGDLADPVFQRGTWESIGVSPAAAAAVATRAAESQQSLLEIIS